MAPLDKERLGHIHFLRMKAHWGQKWAEENAFDPARWPADEKAWRAIGHGHPADTNVEMAKFHWSLACEILKTGWMG